MGSTQFRGYPRVDPGSVPNGRDQINALADAVDADVEGLSAGYKLAAVLHYTSNGTFQKGNYAGIKAVEVEVIGAGGGSAFAATTTAGQISFGAGGGGGGYSHGFILAGALASSETVTVGTGGIAGTSGTPDGGAGGNSSFGTHLTAGGGGGGNDSGAASTASSGTISAGTPGAVGAGTAADIVAPGEGGRGVRYENGFLTHIEGLAGFRSGSPYGVTMHNVTYSSLAGSQSQSPAAGVGVGGGARGPRNGTSSASQNGAAGSNGRVIVRVYV